MESTVPNADGGASARASSLSWILSNVARGIDARSPSQTSAAGRASTRASNRASAPASAEESVDWTRTRAPPLVARLARRVSAWNRPRRESPSSRDACGVAARPSRGRTPRVHPRVPDASLRRRRRRRRPRTHESERDVFGPAPVEEEDAVRDGRSRRPRSSVSNPRPRRDRRRQVSSERSRLGWARTTSSSGLSFLRLDVGRPSSSVRHPSPAAAEDPSRALRAKKLSRLRGAAFAGARGLEPSPFGSRSARLRFRLCFRRRRRAEKFRDASVCRGRRRESDAGSPHARAPPCIRLSLRVEHGDGGVGDGIGRLPRRVDRFSTFGVGDGDGVGRLPRLVAFAPRFFSQKVVRLDRARRRSQRFGKPEASASHLRQLSHASCFPVSQVRRFELGAVLQSE